MKYLAFFNPRVAQRGDVTNPTVVDDYCSAKPGLIREKEEVSLRHIKNEFRAVSP
jgi:hypothetical protein